MKRFTQWTLTLVLAAGVLIGLNTTGLTQVNNSKEIPTRFRGLRSSVAKNSAAKTIPGCLICAEANEPCRHRGGGKVSTGTLSLGGTRTIKGLLKRNPRPLVKSKKGYTCLICGGKHRSGKTCPRDK